MEHDRYYIEGRPSADVVELSREESHHLIHVRRGKPGDAITLFDGLGNEYAAEILKVHKGAAVARISATSAVSRELPYRLTLAFAPTKSAAMDDIIRQATEIGVSILQPVYCENSVVRYKDFPAKSEKLRRTVIESCKQCGRNVLPVIQAPAPFPAFLAGLRASIVLIAHPAPDAQTIPECLAAGGNPDTIVCLVGPEGGFTDNEIRLASSAGAHIVTLGPTRLRAETAAIAMLAAVTTILSRGATP